MHYNIYDLVHTHPQPEPKPKPKTIEDKLEHRGYIGTAEVSLEDNCLHGRLKFIKDLVTYEAQTVAGLKAAFVKAVDDYLEED